MVIQECSGITLYDEAKLDRDTAEAMRAFAPRLSSDVAGRPDGWRRPKTGLIARYWRVAAMSERALKGSPHSH